MTTLDVRLKNYTGALLWQLGNPIPMSSGAYGQLLNLEIDIQTSNAITGIISTDFGLFLRETIPGGGTNPHPAFGTTARGYLLDVASQTSADGVVQMNKYGNDFSRNNGTCSIEITNAAKTEFTVRYQFILCRDEGVWMHETTASQFQNLNRFDETGTASIYEQIKQLAFYVHSYTTGASEAEQQEYSFHFNKYNHGAYLSSPNVVVTLCENYVLGNVEPTLVAGELNSIRIEYDFGSVAPTNVEYKLLNITDAQEGLEPIEAFQIYSNQTTPLPLGGSSAFVTINIPSSEIEFGKQYKLIAIFNSTNQDKNTSIYKDYQVGVLFNNPCLPKTEMKWKTYNKIDTGFKYEIAPYERTRLEFKIYHDTNPQDSFSFIGCWANENVQISSFMDSFTGMKVFHLGVGYKFIKVSDGLGGFDIQAPFGWTHNFLFEGAHLVSVISRNFRPLEENVDTQYNDRIEIEFAHPTTYGDTLYQTVIFPYELKVRPYENTDVSPNITSLDLTGEFGEDRNLFVCQEDNFINGKAISSVDYYSQILLATDNIVNKEHELQTSINPETYFNQRTDVEIYDNESDYSTSSDNTFKIENFDGLDDSSKVLVIGIKK